MLLSTYVVRRTVLGTLVLLLAACNRDVPSAATAAPCAPISTYLTDRAAAALQADGRFSADPGESPDGTPIITEGRARALAMAYLRSFGQTFHSTWEQQRGASIDLSTISVGPRIYFAHTPFGAFPSGFHPAVRRSYGPYYIVPFYSNGTPAIVMAVSAYNTDVTTNAVGQLVLPKLGGMGFIHEGIAVNQPGYRLTSPEDAAISVASGSHARVATPPRLMMRAHNQSPLLAVWQMDTERDVSIKDEEGNSVRTIHTAFVSSRPKERFLRADDVQPTIERGVGPTLAASGGFGPSKPYNISIQAGRAINFKAVNFNPGS